MKQAAIRCLLEALAAVDQLGPDEITAALELNRTLRDRAWLEAPRIGTRSPLSGRRHWQVQSIEGGYLIEVSQEKERVDVVLWAAGSGGRLHEFEGGGVALGCGFLRDGHAYLLWAPDGEFLELIRWDPLGAFERRVISRPPELGAMLATQPARVAPDGDHRVVGVAETPPAGQAPELLRAQQLVVLRLAAGARGSTPRVVALRKPAVWSYYRACFSDGGRKVAIACPGINAKETRLDVIDLDHESEIGLHVDHVLFGISWSPCARYLATMSDPGGYIKFATVFRVEDGQVLVQSAALEDPAGDSPMADSIWYSSADHDDSSALSWDLIAGELMISLRSMTRLRIPGWIPAPIPGPGPVSQPPPDAWMPTPYPAPPEVHLISPDRKFETLFFQGGGCLVWDLENRRLVHRGPVPFQGTFLENQDGSAVQLTPAPGTYLLVRQGRLVDLGQLPALPGIVRSRLDPSRLRVLAATASSLAAIDLVSGEVVWCRSTPGRKVAEILFTDCGSDAFVFDLHAGHVTRISPDDGCEGRKWSWHHGLPRSISKTGLIFWSSFVAQTELGRVVLGPFRTAGQLLRDR